MTPFAFGWPVFNLWGTVALSAVMVVMMIEATGQFLAVGDMANQKISEDRLARGLRTDGIGNIIGGSGMVAAVYWFVYLRKPVN